MNVRPKKRTEKKQEEYFSNLVLEGVRPPQSVMNGITRDVVQKVLSTIDRGKNDIVDVVFALLNDTFPNLFNPQLPFSAGASTAHLGCYVGIFVRHGNKLDREGRDYWLKPLREVGVIELVTYEKSIGFIDGHLKAKSPNSAYRLSQDFVTLLKKHSNKEVHEYFTPHSMGKRLMLQSRVIEYSVREHGRGDHHKLIQLVKEFYTRNFLTGFEIIYIDDSDGIRVSETEKNILLNAGIEMSIDDAWPDIILWDKKDGLWFIEAVASDGEVDESKMANLKKMCKKSGKQLRGATTCYLDWKSAAARQERHKNLAINSYIWIASDPSKHLKTETGI